MPRHTHAKSDKGGAYKKGFKGNLRGATRKKRFVEAKKEENCC